MNSKKFAKGCGNIVSAISKWTTLVFLALRSTGSGIGFFPRV